MQTASNGWLASAVFRPRLPDAGWSIPSYRFSFPPSFVGYDIREPIKPQAYE